MNASTPNTGTEGGDSGDLQPADGPVVASELKAQGFSRSLLERWPGVFFRQRPDLSFELATPHLEAVTGLSLERWLKEPGLIEEVILPADLNLFRRRLEEAERTAEGITTDLRIRNVLTGRVMYLSEFRRAEFDGSGGLIAYEGFWIDQTRQTLAELRLATAAWKESLGLVTLGLAHDFNNLLAGIMGLNDSFVVQLEPGHPLQEGLALVKRNAQHAAKLIERIARLHRGKPGTRSYLNLNDAVKEATELLQKAVPRAIELETDLAADSLPIYADAVELQQVLLNLAFNATEAMAGRGRLIFRTFAQTTPPMASHRVGSWPRLPAAVLAVTDNGIGIPARLLPLLFDPFFTTKPMNRGSGLGLYNARLFAEKHHGAVTVDSSEGSGATFSLWLPQADFTEGEGVEARRERRPCLLLTGRPGRLLQSTAEFLRQAHYEVVLGGDEGEELLHSGDYRFDGVLVLAEPGDLRAPALVCSLRQQFPHLKVIVKTAGSNPDETDPRLAASAHLVISAELPEDSILDRLRSTLDQGAQP